MRGGTSHLSSLSASLDGAGARAGARQSAGPLCGGEGSGSLLGVCFLGACRELGKLLRTLSDPLRGLVGCAGAGLCGAAWAQAWQGGLAEVEVAGRCRLPSASGRPEPGTQWQSGLCSLVHRGVAFFLVACPFVVGCVPVLQPDPIPTRGTDELTGEGGGEPRSCSRSGDGQGSRAVLRSPRPCPFFRP